MKHFVYSVDWQLANRELGSQVSTTNASSTGVRPIHCTFPEKEVLKFAVVCVSQQSCFECGKIISVYRSSANASCKNVDPLAVLKCRL